MNSWLTDRQQLFIERTLRNLGRFTLVFLAAVCIYNVWHTYNTLLEVAPRLARAAWMVAESGVWVWFAAPIGFYWLAHFVRLGREDKPEASDHKGASA